MMDEFTVSFTDPMMIDMDMFLMWLKGYSEQETAKQLAASASHMLEVPFTILTHEVNEQYTTFKFLQQYLQSPTLLRSQLLISLSPHVKQNLVHSYYTFDKDVLREILGRKMSGKLRKDMDDVSVRTAVALQSCRRQFDNIKNVLKTYEDVEGTIADIIHNHFMLDETLSKQYKSIVFIFINRFETLKKKLLYLHLDDFIACVDWMMEYWTVAAITTQNSVSTDQGTDADDIDRQFVHDLRDLRNFILEKDFQDVQKSLVMSQLEKKSVTLHYLKSLDANIRTLSRNIFSVSSSLSNSKEFKDFFLYCVEKVIEPVKNLEWSVKEFEDFLAALRNSWQELKSNTEFSSSVLKLDRTFERYFDPIKKCLLQLYR